MSKSRALDFVKKITQDTLKRNTYERCLRNVEFVSAGNGNCVAEFTVSEEHLNIGGTLHGSFTSTIIDCLSSLALLTTGRGVESVSVNLYVSFLEEARLGDVIIIDSKTIKAGLPRRGIVQKERRRGGRARGANKTHRRVLNNSSPG